jgi:glycosyltransferase involved in cell wall biosynthesis
LAAALCDLLADPERLDMWKARSQLHINNLTIERVARETLSVYKSALSPGAEVVPA